MSVLRSPDIQPGPIRDALRSPLTRLKGGGVSWRSFTSGLTAAQVLDIDFGQTDRHFTAEGGGVLSNTNGNDIAVAMDSATWGGTSFTGLIAAQPELFDDAYAQANKSTTRSTYDSGTGYYIVSRDAGGIGYFAWTPITVGITYHVDMDISPLGGEANSYVDIRNQGTNGNPIFLFNSDQPRVEIYRATFTGTLWQYGGPGPGTSWGAKDISVKAVPGNHGFQRSASLRGKRQAGGVCRYDGLDDEHLTTFRAQNGAMTLLYHGTIDATISATQMFLGASGSGANRCWLAVTTDGFIGGGVGSESTSTIVGTTDVRTKTIVAALTFDGSTVKLFLHVDGVSSEEYSAAQASTPTTTIPFRTGAYNNNGTAAGFAKVDAKSIKAAHKAMTFAQFKSIAASLAA